jgi:hypothetical protein
LQISLERHTLPFHLLTLVIIIRIPGNLVEDGGRRAPILVGQDLVNSRLDVRLGLDLVEGVLGQVQDLVDRQILDEVHGVLLLWRVCGTRDTRSPMRMYQSPPPLEMRSIYGRVMVPITRSISVWAAVLVWVLSRVPDTLYGIV